MRLVKIGNRKRLNKRRRLADIQNRGPRKSTSRGPKYTNRIKENGKGRN